MDSARCSYSASDASAAQQLTSNAQSRHLATSLSLTSALINIVDQSNKLAHVHLPTAAVTVLDIDIPQAFPTKASWVLLQDRGVLFVCGGLEREAKQTVLGVHISSCVGLPLASLLEGRGEAGIIRTQGKVYVFGGRNPELMTSCELYDLETNSWQSIGHMGAARAGLTPVLWKSSILLVGGVGSNSMEVLGLPGHQFHPASLQLPYSDQFTLALVAGDQLVILQREKIVGMSLRGGNRTAYPIATLSKAGFWFSPTEPLYCDDAVYFLDWACEATIWRWDVSAQTLTEAVRFN